MKNKKILRLIAVVLAAFQLLGCGEAATKQSDANVSNEQNYEDAEKIAFFKEGEFQFNIIRSADVTASLNTVIRHSVFKQVRRINQKRPNYLTDAEEINNDLHNIYVGSTTKPDSEEALKIIKELKGNYYDFLIMMRHGDIFIQAASDAGLESALNYFCENILVNMESTIPSNYYYHYKSDFVTNLSIADEEITSYVIVASKYPSGMETRGCEELRDAIKALTDFEVPIIYGETEEYDKKIIVKTEGDVRANYSITVEEGNLVISGGHDYSVNAALNRLALNIKGADKSKAYNIPADYKYEGVYTENSKGTDGYKLIFAEEFDGNVLNEKYWFASDYVTKSSYRTPSAVSVEGGNLVITSQRATLPDGSDGFTTGEINGQNVDFAYGYFECRAKFPKGPGNWVSFWACGKNSLEKDFRPEIDVYESWNTDNSIKSQLHSWWVQGKKVKGLNVSNESATSGHMEHLKNGLNSYELPEGETFADDFHTFGCEWTPAYIKFYCDGVCYDTVDLQSILKHKDYGYPIAEYYMFSCGKTVNIYIGNLLNNMAESLPVVDDTTELPSKYYVDYVHIYQMENIGTNALTQK